MIKYIKREPVLSVAVILAIITSFISIPKIEYINFKVLILLFNLMIIIAAFKELKVLDYIATSLLSKCNTYRAISIMLTMFTFFASMVVTNDVALLTFVPLALIICKKSNISSLKIIILQTLAANLGSSLTPMGNPQNLYIYSKYNITPLNFLKITSPLVLLSIFLLIFLTLINKNSKLNFELEKIQITNKKNTVIMSILLLIVLFSVFGIINYYITFAIVVLTILITNKKLFINVDYTLLLTFIAFFIFTGNISNINSVVRFMSKILSSKGSTYFSSILCSQVISNVPATMLLSSFTGYYKELLLGVNIGGLGTLIASLASVISYKLYTDQNEGSSLNYIKSFTIYNLLGLLVIIPIMYLLMRI